MTEKWVHPAYTAIIAMGPRVVPLILEQISAGKRLWTHALLEITGENPAAGTATPQQSRDAWLRWGSDNGWLTP